MTISVCIPTYNQSAYIKSAVYSAFHQTLKPDEIIVLDDCSTDDTFDIIKALESEIPILKVQRQSKNMGISRNVNDCLRMASGDFVVRLDSDDQLLPAYIQKLASMMIKYPKAGYGHVAIQEVDQYDRDLRTRVLFRSAIYQSPDDALKAAVNGYRVAANIIMFRRSALEEVNFIEASANFAEDYYLSVALAAKNFGNVYVDEVLAKYRIWVDVGNVRQKRKLEEIIGIRNVFENALFPAFSLKGWKTQVLLDKRASLASRQADCLGWKIYNQAEQAQIIDELMKLSSDQKVKFAAWIYRNNLGAFLKLTSNIKRLPSLIIKKALKAYKQL